MSADPLRSFLAVDLAPHARAQAAQVMAQLCQGAPDGVRWVPEENLHLTLKFLGDVEPDRIPKLIAVSTAKLERVVGFEVMLGGLGAFPNARSARVVWLGVQAGGPELARLARKLACHELDGRLCFLFMLDSGTIVSVPYHRVVAIHRVVDQAIAA